MQCYYYLGERDWNSDFVGLEWEEVAKGKGKGWGMLKA